ncbi:hypothetical protein FBU30_011276 [Linnemannia zychae]|nr:hypothetical protein FBU30_011276 [Linnemannia zychae]
MFGVSINPVLEGLPSDPVVSMASSDPIVFMDSGVGGYKSDKDRRACSSLSTSLKVLLFAPAVDLVMVVDERDLAVGEGEADTGSASQFDPTPPSAPAI